MNKAVLVTDMPQTCFDCPFGDTERICEMCMACEREIHDEEGKFDELDIDKPLWCPLKPLPKQKSENAKTVAEETWNAGFNACVDEILGEKE